MAKTNKKYASARMKQNNPMAREDIRKKMSDTLKKIGHKPRVHCGNGSLTKPQMLLASVLGWKTEVVVMALNHPYKVDVAHAGMKIAIEVDGGSHCCLKVRNLDAKKDAALRSLGWTVLRFKNKDVMGDLGGCVRTVWSTISRLKETTTTLPMAS
jgi:hypothetical protein